MAMTICKTLIWNHFWNFVYRLLFDTVNNVVFSILRPHTGLWSSYFNTENLSSHTSGHFHKCQIFYEKTELSGVSTIFKEVASERPSISFSLIVKSHWNPFLEPTIVCPIVKYHMCEEFSLKKIEPTSTRQWGQSFLFKETSGAFEGVWTHTLGHAASIAQSLKTIFVAQDMPESNIIWWFHKYNIEFTLDKLRREYKWTEYQ